MDSLLDARELHAWYGSSHVLHGVDLRIARGQTVGLLGRNGMGKSTTIRSIVGGLRPQRGEIVFDGRPIHAERADAIARLGVAIVPEGRQCFPNLSVHEHLVAFAARRNGVSEPWTPARLYALFPRLAERADHLGNQLSGGEQQMLTLCRALMTNPTVLLLDEPTEGLAPVIVELLTAALQQLRAESGLTMILVEQNSRVALNFCERTIVMDKGRIVHDGASADLKANPQLLEQLIGVSK